jgi:N-methylhydantoinase A
VVEDYHRLHEEFYGYRFEGIPIELVRLTVVVSAPEPELPPLAPSENGGGPAETTREVYFPGGGFVTTPVLRREQVGLGARPGPLVVESMDSTIVVPPDWTLDADATGILELRRQVGEAPP